MSTYKKKKFHRKEILIFIVENNQVSYRWEFIEWWYSSKMLLTKLTINRLNPEKTTMRVFLRLERLNVTNDAEVSECES